MSAGTTETVGELSFEAPNFDLASDGSFVESYRYLAFIGDAANPQGILEHRNGTRRLVAGERNPNNTPEEYRYTDVFDPRTDGSRIVYWTKTYESKESQPNISLMLNIGAQYETLVQRSSREFRGGYTFPLNLPLPVKLQNAGDYLAGLQEGTDYQVNNGWIGFVNPQAAGEEIWMRSPNGVLKQIAPPESRVRIDQVGPDGTLSYFDSERRIHLASFDGSENQVLTPSSVRTFRQAGKWYAISGDTLFVVGPENHAGDMDGDGQTNIADAILLLRALVGRSPLTAGQRTVADLDVNSKLDIRDVIHLLHLLI
jgi:hypothetical protein